MNKKNGIEKIVVLVGVLGAGCWANPNQTGEVGESETGAEGGSETSVGMGTETGGVTGDGDGDPATGDGDGESSGDGDGDGDGGDPCQNGAQDRDETDVDCGGSCSPCETDQMCGDEQDCVSLVCTAGVCVAPSCSDEVLNGDELEADCGGSCRFCEHSSFISQLSDTTEGLLLQVDTAMFEDGGFAIAYLDYDFGARVRWFDESAEALGPATVATPGIKDSNFYTLSLSAGGPDAGDLVYLAVNGNDMESESLDAFAATLDSGNNYGYQPIYQGPAEVSDAALDVDDEVGAFVWAEDGAVWLRHHDYSEDEDVSEPQTANPNFERPGKYPTVATRDGLTVVAWVACTVMGNNEDCDIELRRFDGDWLDDTPVGLGLSVGEYFTPRLAIAADGRVAVTAWHRDDDDLGHAYGAIFDADWNLAGPWLLQGNLAFSLTPSPVVAALSDGSFAFAWSDVGNSQVHVRRYISAAVPLVKEVDDEAPWSDVEAPTWVSLATSGNRLVVAWNSLLDNSYVVQGQVLSF